MKQSSFIDFSVSLKVHLKKFLEGYLNVSLFFTAPYLLDQLIIGQN